MNKSFFLFALSFALAASALAQSIPTATLTGKVTTGGAALPGVTVSVTSPNLQGTRTSNTTEAGDYVLPFLRPGEYTVTFELSGMRSESRRTTLAAARTDRIDIDLRPASLEESITVTADTPLTAPLESTQVSTNLKQDLIEQLPVQRNLSAVTLLAPGVAPTGPSGNLIISGAMSFDSLYLVNGAIVSENLRGQAHDLFIEDAIQETTVMTGAISAEYGHFTGGVISSITKSGSNQFQGSLRDSFTNESWVEKTPFTTDQADEIAEVYEGTLGGPFLRDRLWFFGAGRLEESSDIRQTVPGNARTGDRDANDNPIPVGTPLTPFTYPHSIEETRLEAKLTGSITPRHNIVASYIDIDDVEVNQTTQTILDLDSLAPERETPNTLLALNYSGSFTDRFFLEAQYSEKEFAFIGSGSRFYDPINGTLVLDRLRGARANSPTFKATPEGEQRNHDLFTVKGSYFLSTQDFGSHDIKLGYEDFSEVRKVNNYQSGSDFRISFEQTIIRGNQIFPRARSTQTGTSQTRIIWNPIFVLSEGSDYANQAVFLNDAWHLNEHWTFNLGVRYEKNDAVGGAGLRIADDDAISPRLAAHYDIGGDGRWIVNASYGQYVGRLAEGVANDADPAGRAAAFEWNYRGPAINATVTAPTSELVPMDEVIRRVFEWFNANGGTNLRPLRSVNIPGIDVRLDPNGLTSPNVKEWTLGLGTALGRNGYARVDLVRRGWDDFYTDVVDQSTGKVEDEFGNVFDLTLVQTTNLYEREYTAAQSQFSYRFSPRFHAGGTYTWSRLVGNVQGEDSGSGPITGTAGSYPEYRRESWNYPMGYLPQDRRHRARIWAGYDIPTPVGTFNLTVLQNFDSGDRTSDDFTIETEDFVDDLGYIDPPNGLTYFPNGRGNLKTDDVTRTDLALNYETRLFGNRVRIFVQPEILNVFNEQAVDTFNENILTFEDVDYLQAFNPFTTTPIECPQGATAETCQSLGAHFQRDENFGKADSEGDFQTPRTFRFSVGIKF